MPSTSACSRGSARILRLDADYWNRRSKFAGDQDQFLNTGIVFPLAFTSGRLNGWNVRLDLARTAGFRGFLSLGHTHAEYVPPLTGGLFLDAGALDTLTGGPFLIDHDQKLQAQGALLYDIGHNGRLARDECPLRLRARHGRRSGRPGQRSE